MPLPSHLQAFIVKEIQVSYSWVAKTALLRGCRHSELHGSIGLNLDQTLLSKSNSRQPPSSILPAMARVVPSGRDLRKYARLFLRTDQDSDGYISAEEARDVFSKSYLPPDVLIHIFNQANVSQSPHLSFPEFVAAMHLIREARHTQQPVSISAELMNFLSNFYESPWDLATQGSSKSAQAMKQSAHSTYQAQAAWQKQEI